MDDRDIARQLRQASSINVKLALGFFGGFIVGVVLAAYVVMPVMGLWAALLTIFVAAIVGRWLVIVWLSR